MEKFAVDLDKVLDDFEFNEDCAEQIASVNPPSNNASSSASKCDLESPAPKTYLMTESGDTNKEFNIIPSLDKHKELQQANLDGKGMLGERDSALDNPNYSKNESTLESMGSINHFYTHDRTADSKLTLKQAVLSYDSEPVSLTIHNDISQKFLQKQQNGSGSPKIDNRYDKKLNQSNSKPSVSNVFNSLNEYINAPSGGLDYVHSGLEEQDTESNIESNSTQVSSTNNTNAKQCPLAKNISNTDSGSTRQDEAISAVSIASEHPVSEYQSTVVPSTIGSSIEHKSNTEHSSISILAVPSSDKVESQAQLPNTVTVSGINENITPSYDNIPADTPALASQPVNLLNDRPNADKGISHSEYVAEQVCEDISDSANEQFVQLESKDPSCESITAEPGSIVTPKRTLTEIHAAESEAKPRSEACNANGKQTGSSDAARKVFGFSNIDDLSEEELTKYLAELEEEDKLNSAGAVPEASLTKPQDGIPQNGPSASKDEDAHEAPIFESVTIGELPAIPQAELTEKAKKFPVIDYSKDEKEDAIFAEFSGKPKFEESPNEEALKEEYKNAAKANDETLSVVAEVSLRSPENREREDATDVKNIETVQENCTYSTIVEQEASGDIASEAELAGSVSVNPMPHNPTREIKTHGDPNPAIEERKPALRECSVPTDTAKYDNEAIVKTMEASLEANVNESSDESEKPTRPQTLDIVLPETSSEPQAIGSTSATSPGQAHSDAEGTKDDCQGSSPDVLDSSLESNSVLGKQPPFWIPDSDASSCMLCEVKFTMIKRRHHCRACGKVLCNKCCSMKYKLEYQGNIDSRVCVPCYQLLTKAESEQGMGDWSSGYSTYMNNNEINSPQGRQPNPNNPMEYCSTIPPLQQLAGGLPPPPTVMVPVGVLKREGGTKHRPEGSKSVMFSDELDMSWDLKPAYRKPHSKRIPAAGSSLANSAAKRPNLPRLDPTTECYVPQDPNSLPPTVTIHKGQVSFHGVTDEDLLYRTLKNECEPPVMFAINRNLYAYVKIINLNCCVNKICWNVTSRGLACVGQDEVILLVETLPDETRIPKDLLIFINQLYVEAIKGNTVSELGFSIYQGGNLLGSREHAGFLFIRQTLQCLQKIVLPPAPFLVGLLIHRWETPWAKVFPLRLLLRLGAEYRYYPCPLVSVRFRDALYFEIGHTVMKVLADFRNFGYTLPGVRGLTIHLRNRMTDVMFPRNRYDQVIKGLNNSNDHVLAYASNFSIAADSHLVCIQTNTGDESSYQTQAINIHNKPRTVTGASFIVINGALKSSMGLSAKSSIVEDGLMVEIMPEKMEALKAALKNMQDFSIGCGRQGAPEPDETVNIKWVDNDEQFNIGVKSPIDGLLMDGIPSIRVHNGTDYKGTSRFIRWTEVFIIKSDDHPTGVHDPVDINKLSGNIAKATCTALVKLLDLLATAGLTKLGVRTTIHPDNVGYEAGSEGTKLPPIYMNSLDNELIQVLHKAAQSSQDTHTVLELIFYVLDD